MSIVISRRADTLVCPYQLRIASIMTSGGRRRESSAFKYVRTGATYGQYGTVVLDWLAHGILVRMPCQVAATPPVTARRHSPASASYPRRGGVCAGWEPFIDPGGCASDERAKVRELPALRSVAAVALRLVPKPASVLAPGESSCPPGRDGLRASGRQLLGTDRTGRQAGTNVRLVAFKRAGAPTSVVRAATAAPGSRGFRIRRRVGFGVFAPATPWWGRFGRGRRRAAI